MEAIQEFLKKRKRRIFFGIKMYGAMVLAAALILILLAHGDVQRIWNEMLPAIITTLTAFAAFLVGLVVIKVKMVITLDGFTSEEKSRINREAGKMPQVYDFLITSDVLIVTLRYGAYAIPVRDIVWMYGFDREHTHLYHSGSLFIPVKQGSHYLIVILRNGKRIQIPLSAGGNNWKAEVKYAYEVVKRKRPKVILGYTDELEKWWKDRFEVMVSTVDRGGTTDGRDLEVEYGLNHWYQQEIPDYDVAQNENIYGVLRAEIEGVLFIVMIFGIVLVGLFFYFVPPFDGNGDMVIQLLQKNMWRYFVPAAIMTALPLTMLIVYIKTVLCDSHRRKYGRLLAAYIILFAAWNLALLAFLLLASKEVHGIASFQDYWVYQAGQAETFQGNLVLTEDPVDIELGVRIIKEEGVYYLQSSEAYYKIPKEMYDGSELLQGNYTISYLPHTKYVVSLKDSEGKERLNNAAGHSASQGNGEAAYDSETEWKYGDMIYPKNTNIYGYNDLTQDEKNVFDFLYSRKMTRELEERVAECTSGDVSSVPSDLTTIFSIPVEISKASYQKVITLFEANQKFDSFDPVRYNIYEAEGGNITQLYAGMQIYGDPIEANGYHLEYERMLQSEVSHIAGGLSDDASDKEKIKKIKAYFKKNFAPFDSKKWFDKFTEGSEKEDEEISNNMKLADTGYGLLKTGRGKEQGYMEAFGMIARELGLSVIPVINDDELQYWNKVCLDGKWYNIDLYQMAVNPSEAKKYDLVSDKQMEKNGMKKGTYGGEVTLGLP